MNSSLLLKIWDWTQNDCRDLLKGFNIPGQAGIPGDGPSNGYSIYLVAMLDLWGSIFRNRFGKNEGRKNVSDFLEKLEVRFPSNYDFSGYAIGDLADKLRNNLCHNYGLRVISSAKIDEWLEIGVNYQGPVVFKNGSGRLQIDCLRLSQDMVVVIKEWLTQNNFI